MAHHSTVLGRLEAGAPPAAISKRWTWMFPVLAFAPLVAAALWYLPVRITQGASTAAVSASLSLRLQRAGSDYRVVWNADSPAILNARRGTLLVKDGAFEKELHLDRLQLLSAGILYAPATPDVSFRLAVYGDDPEPAVATVRLLAGSRPAPVASAPLRAAFVSPAQGSEQQEALPIGAAEPAPQPVETIDVQAPPQPADTAVLAVPAVQLGN
jgi:hypothetical protein